MITSERHQKAFLGGTERFIYRVLRVDPDLGQIRVSRMVGAFAAGRIINPRLVRSQLFELDPHDPWTLIGAALILTVAAGLAGFIPALRASRVDPMIALRHE